jgi:phosphate uptake regulator
VASDLRVLVAALRMVAGLERMGELAEHVAKIARMRYPESAIPAMHYVRWRCTMCRHVSQVRHA